MQHKVRLTVIDKKLYPELQAKYCADPNSGPCPMYNVGDCFMFERYGERDDFWHMGQGRQCGEAWDGISRYIYTALQGGSIMHGWMRDDRVMIASCNDGTRPVIFKIERLDYKVLYTEEMSGAERDELRSALLGIPSVTDVVYREEQHFTEVFLETDVSDDILKSAVERSGHILYRID